MTNKTNTTYTLHIDGVATDYTRSTKATVVAAARAALLAKQGYKVEVVTQTGHISFTAVRRHVTKHTKPFTKVITLPENLQHLVPAGYVAAYARLRNTAIVLRNEDAPEPERYAVIDTINGEFAGFAHTTREAGQIMKALGVAVRESKSTVLVAA